jgi:hypothetical protein
VRCSRVQGPPWLRVRRLLPVAIASGNTWPEATRRHRPGRPGGRRCRPTVRFSGRTYPTCAGGFYERAALSPVAVACRRPPLFCRRISPPVVRLAGAAGTQLRARGPRRSSRRGPGPEHRWRQDHRRRVDSPRRPFSRSHLQRLHRALASCSLIAEPERAVHQRSACRITTGHARQAIATPMTVNLA